MWYVRENYVSDPPGINLYVPLPQKMTTGFVRYRCLRSSSALEGYHLHLRECAKSCAMGCGPRWSDILHNEFDWRWIVRAQKPVERQPNPSSFFCFSHFSFF